MPAFRLSRLAIKNFRSFKEESEIYFQPHGMTLIRGVNLDTGGSSYAGKSSIPVAIAMALGFSPFSIKDQKTWGTDGAMSVTLDIETDGGIWTVRRGDKTSLKPPTGETITGVSAVDAKLRQIVGLDPEVLGALTYRRQFDRGLFLKKTDLEKKDFLCKVMPTLALIESAIEKGAEEIKLQEARTVENSVVLSQYESQLRSFPESDLVQVDTHCIEEGVGLYRSQEAELVENVKIQEKLIKELEDSMALTKVQVAVQYQAKIEEAGAAVNRSLDAMKNFQTTPQAVDSTALNNALAKLEEAQRRHRKIIDTEAERLRLFESERRDLEKMVSELRTSASSVGRLNGSLLEKKKALHKAKMNICPTCNQPWVEAWNDTRLWEHEIEKIQTEVNEATRAAEELPLFVAKLSSLRFAPEIKITRFQEIVTQLTGVVRAEEVRVENEIQNLRSQLQQRLTEAMFALSSVQAEVHAAETEAVDGMDRDLRNSRLKLQELYGSLHTIRASLGMAELTLKSTRLENEVRGHESEQRHDMRLQIQDKIDAALTMKTETDSALAAEKDFLDLIGTRGFLGSIFDEILSEITDETNAILGSVANTAHVTLHFSSESLTLKGVSRKEIKPIVTIGGFIANLESGPSGGMATSINLAVDLAVANVVSRRTNSWPGWMILDESFDGLDQPSRETCFEMLKLHAANRLLMVVDHASETKELFSNHIDIEFKDGRSRILPSGDT